ncbi:aminoglycoside phosphotransferase family protein [Desulfitobacterium sp.]|uniref:aminoglycoside phosphotransferase family protein n=1 Tax=Desulfitobacterium sp. TaxID=49981 RepID=UPI002C916F58|nr:aminoglycoside phosphotransferase family protein [Desulfitobacterium sp.]HVJ48134.1 aminoglycoside phosphotransferase family protein [Desulfitobacterium sp.]
MVEKEVKYVEYVKTKFPELNISNIKFSLSDGKHNDIMIINDEYVFKFSKYDWTIAFLNNEVNFINFIRGYVDMPLPIIEYLDKGIAKCNLIKGMPLFRTEVLLLENRDQDCIAEQIGVFFKQLHSIPLKNVNSKNINEISVDLTREGWLSEYEDIQRKVYPYCGSYSKEYIKQVFKPLLENEDFIEFQPALIHADLAPYHFFFDRDSNRINGVIGFNIAGIGDPAYDVGVILDNLGEAFVKRISRYYKDIATFIDRARFYAYVNNLTWAKKVADMITTRDFTHLQFNTKERDIMPIGSKL